VQSMMQHLLKVASSVLRDEGKYHGGRPRR
jgi:hypothetical protein